MKLGPFEINKIHCGDCELEMDKMDENCIDTIITDPPYGLKFMGKKWDYEIPSVKTFKKMLRVAKPGATLLCFAGARTQHRMGCNIEDAGWILKDCIMWIYGSGFPKATDISKQLDKKGGKSLGKEVGDIIKKKRKELGYSIIKLAELGKFYGKINHGGTVSNWETGNGEITIEQFNKLIKILNLNDDPLVEAKREVIGKSKSGCYNPEEKKRHTIGASQPLEIDITAPATPEAKLWDGWKSHGLKPAYEPIIVAMKPNDGSYANNALKHGVSGLNIDACRIGKEIIKSHGGRKNHLTGVSKNYDYGFNIPHEPLNKEHKGRYPANIILDEEAGQMLDEQSGINKSSKLKTIGGFGTNSKTEGGGGVINYERGYNDMGGASRFFYCAKASKSEREEINHHPTVKPLKLMRYLCRLTKTPTGGIVFDPFAGSGTTLLAAKLEGRHFLGFEKEENYCKIAQKRLNSVKDVRDWFKNKEEVKEK